MRQLFRVLLALAVLATAANAQVATPIAKLPFTIKKPGVYALKKNLTFPKDTGTAIIISADDVVLDLQRRTLSNSVAENVVSTAVGIQALGARNVTVRNGTVRGFAKGIVMNGGSPAGQFIVEEIIAASNLNTAIEAQADGSIVRKCRVTNTGAGVGTGNVWGILAGGEGIIVADNVVVNTSGATSPSSSIDRGIQVFNQGGSVVENNRVINETVKTGSSGIILFGGQNYFITNNFVSHWTNGIVFANGAGGKYRDNLTVSCTTPFSGGTSVGTNN